MRSAWTSSRPAFRSASPADAEAVRQIATEIRRPIIACLARCHRADLERAAWAIKPAAQGRIHTFIATSDLHLQAKLRMTREQCMEAAVESVRYARQHTFDVQFSAEDATRSDFDFLCRVVEAVIKVGRHDDQPARYRRLLDAGRDAGLLPPHS